eukprot:GHVN01013171.1.p1 GENE.GHVN01013171.1~~GHVN01013171.1.p1  ORF type:complete len:293 (+),score=45.09 GHVN01013171.1:301-1179(+)
MLLMGDTLGKASCCSGRDDFELKRRTNQKLAASATDAVDDDVTRYDRAFDTNDIKVFVELLTSNQRIDQVEERMHPWAAEPQTVGALCATQLAVLASRDSIASDVKESIRELGGIPPLVKLLDSHDEDRVHASTIVLSFLSVENQLNCLEMQQQGALRFLIRGMSSPIDGMRAVSAQTARNIFIHDRKFRLEFETLGGVQKLVDLLQICGVIFDCARQKLIVVDDDPSTVYTRLEALYHIEDLIFDGGYVMDQLKFAVTKLGVKAALLSLIDKDEQIVASQAAVLLERLEMS